MARFRLEISMDNDAFRENRAEEVARILGRLVETWITDRGLPAEECGALFDINGNRVGSFEVDEEEEE